MKRISLLFLFTVLFAVSACSGPQTPIKELKKIVSEVEKNYDKYTEEELDKVLARLDAVDKEMDKYEYTDEEMREIGRLNGRITAYLTKAAFNNLGATMNDLAKELGGGIEGFFEAFGVEGVEFATSNDDLSDEELREAGRQAGKKFGKTARKFALKLGAGIEGFAEEFEKEMEKALEDID